MTMMLEYLLELQTEHYKAMEADAIETLRQLEQLTSVHVPRAAVDVLPDGGLQVFGFRLYRGADNGYEAPLHTYAVVRDAMPLSKHTYRYQNLQAIHEAADWIRLLREHIPYDIAVEQSRLAEEYAGGLA